MALIGCAQNRSVDQRLVADSQRPAAARCRQPAEAPAGLSAVVVPGDGLGHQFAVRFLHGCSPGCLQGSGDCSYRPGLHVPSDWRAGMIHPRKQFPDYRNFFWDAETVAAGRDRHRTQGLEQAHLVFYGGHGFHHTWNARKGTGGTGDRAVELDRTSLGDGATRYFWMISCNVMAHGPRSVAAGRWSYGQPESFDPARFDPHQSPHQEDHHANVFYRWARTYEDGDGIRSPLGPRLRMACGGSTKIGGGDDDDFPTARIWQYRLIHGFPVADSFIAGLALEGRVPLCITHGDRDPVTTPLFDADFFSDPYRRKRGPYLFIQYPEPLPAARAELEALLGGDLDRLPQPEVVAEAQDPTLRLPAILELAPTPLPRFLDVLRLKQQELDRHDYGFLGATADQLWGEDARWLGALGLDPRDVQVRFHPGSGAVIISWRPEEFSPEAPNRPPADFEWMPRSLGNGLGISARQLTGGATLVAARHVAPPLRPARPMIEGARMRIDRVDAGKAVRLELASPDEVDCFQKCSLVEAAHRLIDDRGVSAEIFGGGGRWLWRHCPGPSVTDARNCAPVGPEELSLTIVGREIVGVGKPETGRHSRNEAEAIARGQLAELETRYGPARLRWGYRSAPIHCRQDRMVLVYRFDFQPKTGPANDELPPRSVEVPVLRPAPGTVIEDEWHCDPRRSPEGS